MTVASRPEIPTTFRLTRAQYDRMIETGVLSPRDKVELVFGVIVPMSPQGAPHSGVIQNLTRLLARALPEGASVRVQLPLSATDDSEPEPDLAVVPERGDAHHFDHPRSAHLVIEVARGSLTFDLELKARLYAEAGIPEYWVVDVTKRTVWVHRRPNGSAYAAPVAKTSGDTLVVEAFPDITFPVDALFPKP